MNPRLLKVVLQVLQLDKGVDSEILSYWKEVFEGLETKGGKQLGRSCL